MGVSTSDSKSSIPRQDVQFVLVHGAWHGGWCWSRVAPMLRAEGYTVWTPTLTGLAERAAELTPAVGLTTHIDDIVSLFETEQLERVILVGHSSGGMVISGAAARLPGRIAGLVFLDAFVPETGKSQFDYLPPDRAAYYRERAATGGDGWRIPPPPAAILGVTDGADAAWLETTMTPHPLLGFAQPVPASAPAFLPRTFIRCAEGPLMNSFNQFAEPARTDPAWSFHELASGHDAMVTHPAALADLLLTTARAAGSEPATALTDR